MTLNAKGKERTLTSKRDEIPVQIPSPTLRGVVKGLLVVWDFCFWVVWAAGPVLKKKVEADYEQLLRAVLSCFRGHLFFVFGNSIA